MKVFGSIEMALGNAKLRNYDCSPVGHSIAEDEAM
jgi:hypothetical protein